MSTSIRLDGTNLLVFGGVLVIVGAGSWQFIGAYLIWAVWQVVLYYVVLVVVAAVLFGALFAAVGGGDGDARWKSNSDRVDETTAE